MMDDFRAYYGGIQDGARGVLSLLRSLLENGFGWLDALEAAEEWIKYVQRSGGTHASPTAFPNQTHCKRRKREET